MFKSFKSKLGLALGAVAVTANSAMATNIDLSTAQSDIESAGSAMIGLAVVMLGIGLVYGFIRKRG